VGLRQIGQPSDLVATPPSKDTMAGLIEPSGEFHTKSNDSQPSRLPSSFPGRPCRVTFDGANAPEATRTEVRAWLERLGALTAPMTGGHVAIESIDEIRKDRVFRVRVELAMPAGVVVVGSDHPSNAVHEDIYVAIRNAFRGARRQLEAYCLEHPVVAESQPTAVPSVVCSG
jgi:ribosome-associated translation inhibitor RaiA